jgi:hypothetical protein
MYENGKMKPVQTVPEMGGWWKEMENDRRGELNYEIV